MLHEFRKRMKDIKRLFIFDRRNVKMESEMYQTMQQVANVENEYASLQGRVRPEGTVTDSPAREPEHTDINNQSTTERSPAHESIYEEISLQPSEHQ